jgi:ABC-type microcin C transport system permease subunit YejE
MGQVHSRMQEYLRRFKEFKNGYFALRIIFMKSYILLFCDIMSNSSKLHFGNSW